MLDANVITLYFIPKIGNCKVMGKNTSISIGQHFDEFIKERISEGRYQNASEVIRAGLRLLEEQETKVAALRAAINEGLESGVSDDFDKTSFLQELKNQEEM
jgi:antitoxin ParD1/3/4